MQVDSDIRCGAAIALINLPEAGAKYLPDILNVIKEAKVGSNIGSSLVIDLGKIRKLKTQSLFADIWTPSQERKPLQQDLADKIAEIVYLVSWKPGDMSLLETQYNNLTNGGYYQADTVLLAMNKLKGLR
jgi:hypothetical protein